MKIISQFFAKIQGDRWFVYLTGLCLSIIVLVLFIKQPKFIDFFNSKIYDLILRQTHSQDTSGIPIIVDIDEKSLKEYGQWPWPRYRVALLIAKIRQAGALSVGMDILFAEPDRTSPLVLKSQLKKDLKVDIDFVGMPEALMDNDQVLSGVLSQGPYVLGYYFNFNEIKGDEECILHPVNTSIIYPSHLEGNKDKPVIFDAPSVTCPIKILSEKAVASGFFNIQPDIDGILRSAPLVMSHKGKYYPSLPLAALMQATGLDSIIIKAAQQGAESIKFGKTIIPLSKGGQMLINFRGGQKTFKYISAGDILSDRVPADIFDGKITLIGTSAAGLLDIRSTPLAEYFPGVEVHATIIDNILKQDFLSRPPDYMIAVEAFVIILAGLLTTLLLAWSRAVWSFVPVLFTAIGLWYGTVYYFTHKGIFISPLFAYITIVGNFVFLTLVKYWREEGHKNFLHSTFESYLSPELINEMLVNKSDPKLGGETKQITAYFTDIQGFSTFSEKLTAQELVELLNEYLSAMTDILLEEKGTLDKYEGDAIIAFFGAPMDLPDHALRACHVAVSMQNQLIELCEKWRNEVQDENLPDRNSKKIPADEWHPGKKWPEIVHNMKMRIGINSGDIVVGNMGSSMRMNYTMMGDSVNLAARLEEGAKQFGIYTCVSDFTMQLPIKNKEGNTVKIIDLLEARLIDNIIVVGKSDPVKIYELCAIKGGLTSQEKNLFSYYDQGMEKYKNMEWDEAISFFEKALKVERVPDGKTTPSEVFINRCKSFKENPPVKTGEQWDGVYRMTKK